ncbi:4-hydroxy-3-methylbut-2-enyl diphosphate reductase [Kribbella sindirgiensis]|uniref:4-hydroxy-3-methylbut-2-enyl diphosphate reductase n=1 Tax=Kribbella sindirgiensis TaxID=1124744 RepID=A0A4R0ITT5_9ACTN|nr:4-hydroxy-3-methylbut-2-enyl diphosphate reductase [Kribbella sindirgiensis]TCC34926.1 4-hydroxy-3-methylbut-2-enyl diphosphate reductase [Kribbella sindirgiensis]
MTTRTILLPSPRAFCAGVERAVEIVERLLADQGSPIYVRKQIVHNLHVVDDLQSRGAVFVDELDEVPPSATVVFSAHGVAPAVRAEAVRRGLDVVDATCPLVTKVHAQARRYAAAGDTVILIGHADHEEVEGTMGEVPEQTVLVETVDDVTGLTVSDPDRIAYLTQTTLSVDETTVIVEALRSKFPSLRGPAVADICYATSNRQAALSAVVHEADIVLVVGSENSSNSRRLVELALRNGTPARLIDDADELQPEWLDGAQVIGITAGASAPPRLVDEVVRRIASLGPVEIIERAVAVEDMTFTLPLSVRQPASTEVGRGN